MALTRIGLNQSINLASNVTGTLPIANGGTAITSGFINGTATPGKVLQVQSGSHSSQATTTSTSFQDVSTDVNVSLTCSATSSKVLIIARFHELYLNGSHNLKLRVTAGGTQIMRFDGAALTGASGEKVIGETNVFVYSPSSTSAIEYKMQFASQNGSEVRVNQHSNPAVSLVLMEIAG